MTLLTACSTYRCRTLIIFETLLVDCWIYVLLTSPESVFLFRVAHLTQPEDPYHPTFEVAIDIGKVLKVNSEKSTNRIPCFRKTNFRRLHFNFYFNFIAGFNWSDLYSCNIMTYSINMFYTAIKSFFDSCVPMYYPSILIKS